MFETLLSTLSGLLLFEKVLFDQLLLGIEECTSTFSGKRLGIIPFGKGTIGGNSTASSATVGGELGDELKKKITINFLQLNPEL